MGLLAEKKFGFRLLIRPEVVGKLGTIRDFEFRLMIAPFTSKVKPIFKDVLYTIRLQRISKE
jgi:hypothetical protein